MPSQRLPRSLKNQFNHLTLADPKFDQPGSIDLLLGADVFSQVMDGRKLTIDKSLPDAFGSVFGWIVIGSVDEHASSITHHVNYVSLAVSIEDIVQRFWQVEEPSASPVTFTTNGQCEVVFNSERIRDASGRFVVPLPFRQEHTLATFPGSRQVALRRFLNLEKKLQADDRLYKEYKQFMEEYQTLGHMSVATQRGEYFIPHHAVVKTTPSSLKLRVVFDASAAAHNGLSLNQCLHTGPKLQQDIIDVLTRFRVHRYCFTADVCKMYRQILVLPEYRKYQHVFWRSSPLEEVKEYQLTTVTYGVNCAPYLALKVLSEIAESECHGFPNVREALTQQTYVDDICVGADNVDSIIVLQADLQTVLARAGFELKKWASNSTAVLLGVPPTDRIAEVTQFSDKEDCVTKVLGLQWDPTHDVFGFNVHLTSCTPTKRAVLSTIARIYDPIGFIAPVIFYAKSIMQRLWKLNLSWDEPLPPELNECWCIFVKDLSSLSKLQISRCLNTQSQAKVQLCGFCDASEQGYSAVVYLRLVTQNNSVSVSLLGSKTKMAPTKSSTVPRLELCAAVLLANWMARLQDALKDKLVVESLFAWSDSQIVLSWLVKPHTMFKIFVSNRVHQIHQLLPRCKWGYIRSTFNPADCASRGMLPSDLIDNSLYWSGPNFLYNVEDTWDTTPTPLPAEQLPDIKIVSLAVQREESSEWICRFSSYSHMLRIISWVRRFIGRCRRHQYAQSYLTKLELDETLICIVHSSQCLFFNDLYTSLKANQVPTRSMAKLRPFIDIDGVIRVGGRLRHSELPAYQKQPILLPKFSHLSLLIVRHWHLVTCHSGPRVITSLITRQFWILSVRVVIRKVIGLCVTCVRAIASTPHPVMADLPSVRVQASRPFSKVGIDFAGPLQMRECSLRKARQYKVYVAVFVCMAVKAVHLELVLELSTDAFLASFDRFVARRGLPHEIFSDCGTNFVGASKQLSTLVNHPDNQHIISSHVTCSWNFNPPAAPHFGGLWEAAVRSFKKLFVRLVGCHNLTLEEMSTVLCRIEAVLNSRPLTPMSTSPMDTDYLTPGHFLIGQPLIAVPESPVSESVPNVVSRWKLLHQCYQAFWRRWVNEYLCSLQERSKWVKDIPNIQMGDMVIVKDTQLPPSVWRLGRIIETKPGSDGVVRVVKILTAKCRLPIS